MDKYELVGEKEIKLLNGRKVAVYRIRALKSFKNEATRMEVKKGELGGKITPNALSQNGTCWVDESSLILDSEGMTRVTGDSYVGSSILAGNINVSDSAVVAYSQLRNKENACMEIVENARVVGTKMTDNVRVAGRAEVSNCEVSGQVLIDGQSFLENCNVTNNSEDKTKVVTIRLFGTKQSDITLHDRRITEKTPIVNDVNGKEKI